MAFPPDAGRVLAALDVGVLVQDADARILHANAAAERILGVPRDDMLRRDSRDERWIVRRLDGSTFEQQQLPVYQALRSGQPVKGGVLGVDRQGSTVWLSVDATGRRQSGWNRRHDAHRHHRRGCRAAASAVAGARPR